MGKMTDVDKERDCCDERRVMDGSVESLNCTPETTITLYINYWAINKNLERKKRKNWLKYKIILKLSFLFSVNIWFNF